MRLPISKPHLIVLRTSHSPTIGECTACLPEYQFDPQTKECILQKLWHSRQQYRTTHRQLPDRQNKHLPAGESGTAVPSVPGPDSAPSSVDEGRWPLARCSPPGKWAHECGLAYTLVMSSRFSCRPSSPPQPPPPPMRTCPRGSQALLFHLCLAP